jgi:type IV pilus assembly protein PilA
LLEVAWQADYPELFHMGARRMHNEQILQQIHGHFTKCAALVAVLFLVATACSAQGAPSGQQPQDALSQALKKHPGLAEEFARLLEKYQQTVQYPPPRTESRLLPLLPQSTVAFAAISNYGEVARQALKIFRQELQENSALRDWWTHGDLAVSGPKVEDGLEKFAQFHDYLGEEIAVSSTVESKNAKPLLIAELRKPGLKQFLQQMIEQFANKSKPGIRVLDPQELAIAKENPAGQELLVLVRPDFVVATSDLGTLRSFNARLDRGTRDFISTDFGQRVAQEYQGGVTILAAADVQKILNQAAPDTKQNSTFQQSGFADMKYLVWAHKRAGGGDVSEMELSFNGPRHAAASWLAPPRPLTSLDFVSPKAILAGTLVLKNPAQIFDEARELTGPSNANAFAAADQFSQALKLNVKDDLLGLLGGEITVELDNVTPPQPAWKAFLAVKDASHVQQSLTMLAAATNFVVANNDEGGVTYYSFRVPSGNTATEITYAFADGYMILAPSHDAVSEAIQAHRSGESLGKSNKFLASLPPGHSREASALLYQNSFAMTALRLQKLAPELAAPLAQYLNEGAAGVACLYGEESAIREASSGSGLDAGAILIVAAIAIPNLLRSKIAANEASAVGSLRTVNTAQVTYQAAYPKRGFAPELATFGSDPRGPNFYSADHAGLVDPTLANPACTASAWCTKSGYRFRMTATCKLHLCSDYLVFATPENTGTGTRSFCTTSDGIIRFNVGSPLTSMLTASECKAWQPIQ